MLYQKIPKVKEQLDHIGYLYSTDMHVHGFKYVIYIRKRELISHANVVALLSPFSFIAWSSILFSVLSPNSLLTLINAKNMVFWFVSVVLEQHIDI